MMRLSCIRMNHSAFQVPKQKQMEKQFAAASPFLYAFLEDEGALIALLGQC